MDSETNPVNTYHTKQGTGEDNDHYILFEYCHIYCLSQYVRTFYFTLYS